MSSLVLEFIFRWAHVLFGITWIGLLYYFNFVQTEYFKEAEADAKADAVKIAEMPSAAAIVCSSAPAETPKTDAIPAILP